MYDASTMPIHTGLRVLVVEDDACIAMMLEDILSDLGCTVVAVVASAAAAMRASETATVDLALMDVDIAGPADGVEAACDLRRLHGVASLFVTSHQGDAFRRRAEAATPLGYVSKPYAPSDIDRAIHAARLSMAA